MRVGGAVGEGWRRECSAQSPSRKVETWSSCCGGLVQGQRNPRFASPTHTPPHASSLASFLHVVNCKLHIVNWPPSSAFWPPPPYSPPGGLYDITSPLAYSPFSLTQGGREVREVQVFIPLAPTLQGHFRLAVSLG